MRVYLKKNVLDAARERMAWIFDEFDNVVCNFSGGKDSTVILHLALEEAQRRGRLPLPVMFIDQEAEWQATIDHMREVMAMDGVLPLWYQIPFQIFNSTSITAHWLYCWDNDAEMWMRDKEPDSIHENTSGEVRFHKMFEALIKERYGNQKVAMLSGTRTEESPSRYFGLTSYATYKWVTWGRVGDSRRGYYTFCPIYDWAYTDVWKAIHDHGWSYNRLYDYQYQYGVPIARMRVSNLHHVSSVYALFYLQEIEKETYDRLTRRIPGIDMAAKFGKDDFWVDELPFMFDSWMEYRDFLFEKLIDPKDGEQLWNHMKRQERHYLNDLGDKLLKVHVNAILSNDLNCTKLGRFDDDFKQTNIRRRNAAGGEHSVDTAGAHSSE